MKVGTWAESHVPRMSSELRKYVQNDDLISKGLGRACLVPGWCGEGTGGGPLSQDCVLRSHTQGLDSQEGHYLTCTLGLYWSRQSPLPSQLYTLLTSRSRLKLPGLLCFTLSSYPHTQSDSTFC